MRELGSFRDDHIEFIQSLRGVVYVKQYRITFVPNTWVFATRGPVNLFASPVRQKHKVLSMIHDYRDRVSLLSEPFCYSGLA